MMDLFNYVRLISEGLQIENKNLLGELDKITTANSDDRPQLQALIMENNIRIDILNRVSADACMGFPKLTEIKERIKNANKTS